MSTFNDPRYLQDAIARSHEGRPVEEFDRECPHCQYDLAGLAYGKPCPECGNVIRFRHRGSTETGIGADEENRSHPVLDSLANVLIRSRPYERDRLSHTPILYINLVTLAFVLLGLGVVSLVMVSAVAFTQTPSWLRHLVTPSLVCWLAGVGILTLPQPSTEIVTRSRSDRRLLRVMSLVTQLLWIPAFVLAVLPPSGTTLLGAPINLVGARALVVVALLGSWVFIQIPVAMAEWMHDEDTGVSLRRRTFWALVVIFFALAGGTLRVPLGIPSKYMILGLDIVPIIILVVSLYFFYTFLRLANESRWTVREARRVREKVATMRAQREEASERTHQENLDRPHEPTPEKLWWGEGRRGNWR
ncbi:MAG: hypothetical protein ACF8GE_06035 [Phycisphaerales bacterium JB043]